MSVGATLRLCSILGTGSTAKRAPKTTDLVSSFAFSFCSFGFSFGVFMKRIVSKVLIVKKNIVGSVHMNKYEVQYSGGPPIHGLAFTASVEYMYSFVQEMRCDFAFSAV